jgi:hypothetical protein
LDGSEVTVSIAVRKRQMITRLGKGLTGAAVVVILVVIGTFLPGELASRRDRLILGQIREEPLDDAEISDYINVSMVDKVSLLGPADSLTLVPLITGAVYDQDSIREKFTAELIKLNTLGLLPLPDSGEMSGFRANVILRVKNDAPAINMIVWEINIRSEEVSGVFYLDDQTGKILSYNIEGKSFERISYDESAVAKWAAYLGADVKNIKKSVQNDGETVWLFELTSASDAVGGRINDVRDADNNINRWSLSYPRINNERIIVD